MQRGAKDIGNPGFHGAGGMQGAALPRRCGGLLGAWRVPVSGGARAAAVPGAIGAAAVRSHPVRAATPQILPRRRVVAVTHELRVGLAGSLYADSSLPGPQQTHQVT